MKVGWGGGGQSPRTRCRVGGRLSLIVGPKTSDTSAYSNVLEKLSRSKFALRRVRWTDRPVLDRAPPFFGSETYLWLQ